MLYEVDEYIWKVRMYLWKKCGSTNETDIMIYPLTYYVNTGRASTPFLKALLKIKPYIIGRHLIKHKDGCLDDQVKLLKEKVLKSF